MSFGRGVAPDVLSTIGGEVAREHGDWGVRVSVVACGTRAIAEVTFSDGGRRYLALDRWGNVAWSDRWEDACLALDRIKS